MLLIIWYQSHSIKWTRCNRRQLLPNMPTCIKSHWEISTWMTHYFSTVWAFLILFLSKKSYMLNSNLYKTPRITYSSFNFIPSKKIFAFPRSSFLLPKPYIFKIERLDHVVNEKVIRQKLCKILFSFVAKM